MRRHRHVRRQAASLDRDRRCDGLKLFSEKTPNAPAVELLDIRKVKKIWDDFEPYRRQTAAVQQ
jgi:hypothetical protein